MKISSRCFIIKGRTRQLAYELNTAFKTAGARQVRPPVSEEEHIFSRDAAKAEKAAGFDLRARILN